MATFEAKVYKINIEEHPNADALEVACIGDYKCIVGKGSYNSGDLAVYIPEAAILPDWVISRLGLEGKLAGKQKNRVKAIKLRGVLSQGLVFPLDKREDGFYLVKAHSDKGILVKEGDVVTDVLGITKYEPPIPTHMNGEVFSAYGKTISYDIENIKKYPDVFKDGEEVIFTEKIHGTWCCFGFHPDVDSPIITSKGLSAKGLVFKLNENNLNNLYVKMFNNLNLNNETIIERAKKVFGDDTPFYILGEIYGKGVQDLVYDEELSFRMFDVYVGEPGSGEYLNPHDAAHLADSINIDCVPLLYHGSYSKNAVEFYTNGNEMVSGKEKHIREGIVIKPIRERKHPELGRVILKSVSEAYILRKGGTEYN